VNDLSQEYPERDGSYMTETIVRLRAQGNIKAISKWGQKRKFGENFIVSSVKDHVSIKETCTHINKPAIIFGVVVATLLGGRLPPRPALCGAGVEALHVLSVFCCVALT
jgi:hypothetical protein